MQTETPKITAIDNILTCGRDDAAFEPYALSLVYADAAARAAVKGGTSEDPWSDYVARWSGVLGELGWQLRSAGHLVTSLAARAPQPTLAAALATTDVTAARLLAAVTERAGQASAALDFWWGYVRDRPDALSLAFAAFAGGATPTFNAAFFTVPTEQLRRPSLRIVRKSKPLDTSTWSSLLAPLERAPQEVGLRQFTAVLDPDRFAGRVEAVRAALGRKFGEHYQTLD
jgi:hypothetical protein